jgi:two-component system response regulator
VKSITTLNTDYLLLVEDNPDDEKLIMRALKHADLADRVIVMRDGVEALEYLRSAPELPRLILLDIKLPRVDGLEVLRTIRAEARTRTLPVVMLTSSNEQADILASYQLGANSYVCKPVEFMEFRDTVAKLGVYWLAHNQPPPIA